MKRVVLYIFATLIAVGVSAEFPNHESVGFAARAAVSEKSIRSYRTADKCTLLTEADAAKILGGPAENTRTATDGSRSDCEFKLNPKVVLYVLVIESPTDEAAVKIYDEIWNSNKDHDGIKSESGVGDVSYSHADRPNFLFFAARSGRFNVRLKVNKAVEGTSLEEMKRSAKRIIEEINK